MTGQEHYCEAETLLEEANDLLGVTHLSTHIALAQVHATLALAAATRSDIVPAPSRPGPLGTGLRYQDGDQT